MSSHEPFLPAVLAARHVLGREFRPFAFIISLATVRVTASLLTATVYAVLP